MSFAKAMIANSPDKFVIPCAGKMFHSSIGKKNWVLGLVLNKGYFESNNLSDNKRYIEAGKKYGIIPVGGNDYIRKKDGSFCFRQRVFFHSIVELCDLCSQHLISIRLDRNFSVTINNLMNCREDLAYLERYARLNGDSINTYLTNTCIIQLYNLLVDKDLNVTFLKRVDHILEGRVGYLERAPLLISDYSIDNHTSAVYIPRKVNDDRIYTSYDMENIDSYGYTLRGLKSDRKAGVLNGHFSKKQRVS